jgi:hypothetical protein
MDEQVPDPENFGGFIEKSMPQKTTCGVTDQKTCDKRGAKDSLGCTTPCDEDTVYENTVGVCTPAYCACRSHLGDDTLYKHSSVFDVEYGCGNDPRIPPPHTQNFDGKDAKEACDACAALWLTPQGGAITCPA